MIIKYAFASAALTLILAFPLSAQQPATGTFGSASNVRIPTDLVETSTIVAALQEPHMVLWLIARRTGMVVTRGANGELTRPTGVTNPIPNGMYLMLLNITDTTMLKKIDAARATVLVVSPTDLSTSIDFNPTKGGFGCALTLPEKGEYRFTVNVHAGKQTRRTQFNYAVK
jgi:hypothetical protein